MYELFVTVLTQLHSPSFEYDLTFEIVVITVMPSVLGHILGVIRQFIYIRNGV